MTRKRFIKLAMSYGIQRNDAAVLASIVRGYGSYANLLAANSMRFAATKAKRTIQRTVGKVVKQVLQVGKEFLNKVSAAFSKMNDIEDGNELWPQG